MGTLRLHPKDCEKYGVAELVEFEVYGFGIRQRKAFEKATGRTLRWMFDQIEGVPELDEHSNPIPEPVIDEETGEQKVDNGEPVFEPRLVTDPDAIVMFVWLVLWGEGVRVPWPDFDVREIGLRLNFSSDSSGEPGKDEAPTDSESSTTDRP